MTAEIVDYSKMSIEQLSDLCTQKYTEKKMADDVLKDAAPHLFRKMADADTTEVKTPFGRYYKSHSTKYEYSPETQELANKLAEAQEREKNEGVAKKIETPTYKYGKLTKKDAESF